MLATTKKPTAKLTKQEEVFVNALANGMTQRQAYYKAYPHSKKWKEESADQRASRLFSEVKVRSRFNELKEEIAEELKQETIASKQEVLEFFTRLMRREEKEQVVSSKSKKDVWYDEEGRRVEKQTKEPVVVVIDTKNSDAYKGAEALAKHYGAFLATDVNEDELSAVDNLLKLIKGGSSDDTNE